MQKVFNKQFLFATVFIGVFFLAQLAVAEEKSAPITSLSKEEKAFVDQIGKLNRAQIIAILGEPAKADDVKLKDSGRVVASIWHYHHINVDEAGKSYETTELDIVDDRVEGVVFLNNDGAENQTGQTYQIPSTDELK